MRNSFTGMVACDTALRLIAGCAAQFPVRVIRVPLADALGRCAAEDVHAVSARPEADISAMDGYAFAHAAMAAASGGLPVAGQTVAGDLPEPLASGFAQSVLTGARIPLGADCVMAKERMRLAEHGRVMPDRALAEKGANIRRAGEEFPRGETLLARGTRLDWRHSALLACQGFTDVAVVAPVRVAVVSSGAELAVDAPDARADSNSPMLAALLREAGAEVVLHTVPSDSPEALSAALAEAWAEADVLVTTGGISVGQTDNVLDALRGLGAETLFRGVTIRPGKPLTVLTHRQRVAFCLPGNPGASAICAVVFLLPYIRAAMDTSAPACIPGAVDFAFTAVAGTTHFIPVSCYAAAEGWRFLAVPTVGASDIIAFSRASALLRVDPETPAEVGQVRWALPLQPSGI